MATKDLPTVLGTTTFDANGDASRWRHQHVSGRDELAAEVPVPDLGQGIASPHPIGVRCGAGPTARPAHVPVPTKHHPFGGPDTP